MNFKKNAVSALAMLAVTATGATPTMKREPFAKTADGQAVERFTLTNRNGVTASFITWGASLTELLVPDRNKKFADVTLGFDKPEPWLKPHPFFGCVAGRFANRIAGGKFTLDGKTFQLATNNGANHLHGGNSGFDKRNWNAAVAGVGTVIFTYTSPDGEEGYPGKLDVSVTYTLTDDDELRIDYEATTDKPTVLNLTNHTYWNLGAAPDVLGHELRLNATRFTAVDSASIPTGELAPAKDAMDFTTAKPVGRDIAALKDSPGGGYDHNFILDGWKPNELTLAAEVRDPVSGRTMTVTTTEPAVQFYTGNYLKAVAGRAGRVYEKHAGLCLETQHYPDSPNRPEFPTTTLKPGEKFRSTTIYKFSAK
jgi:aldose 1-epimerase